MDEVAMTLFLGLAVAMGMVGAYLALTWLGHRLARDGVTRSHA
ncbi:MAG: hypothetical protein Q8O86_01865 [Dehalococcoidia bacterium]|nr:hypothetical protein [Dehalococcoidia bacterium]